MKRARTALAIAAILATSGCGGGDGLKGGVVTVTLNGPPARAVVFRVVGPQSAIQASGTQFRVFSTAGAGDTATVALVANQGVLLSGAVVQITVPNLAVPPTATLLQVAAPNYSLQVVNLYTLVIAQASGN